MLAREVLGTASTVAGVTDIDSELPHIGSNVDVQTDDEVDSCSFIEVASNCKAEVVSSNDDCILK